MLLVVVSVWLGVHVLFVCVSCDIFEFFVVGVVLVMCV